LNEGIVLDSLKWFVAFFFPSFKLVFSTIKCLSKYRFLNH
jgi:hypothetical protein